MAKAFNHKQPFGIVYGAPGVAFDQNGIWYSPEHHPVDEEGNRLTIDDDNEPVAPKPALAAKASKPAAKVEKKTADKRVVIIDPATQTWLTDYVDGDIEPSWIEVVDRLFSLCGITPLTTEHALRIAAALAAGKNAPSE